MQCLSLRQVIFQVVTWVLQLLQCSTHDFSDIGLPNLFGFLDCLAKQSLKFRPTALISLHFGICTLS